MTQDDLAQMSRDELIERCLQSMPSWRLCKRRYEALKLKLEKGKKPPTNSSNSSQPPSRDQKANGPKDEQTASAWTAGGACEARAQVCGQPDHIVNLKAEVCTTLSCRSACGGGSLGGCEPDHGTAGSESGSDRGAPICGGLSALWAASG